MLARVFVKRQHNKIVRTTAASSHRTCRLRTNTPATKSIEELDQISHTTFASAPAIARAVAVQLPMYVRTYALGDRLDI